MGERFGLATLYPIQALCAAQVLQKEIWMELYPTALTPELIVFLCFSFAVSDSILGNSQAKAVVRVMKHHRKAIELTGYC